jgi:hypothetical protein
MNMMVMKTKVNFEKDLFTNFIIVSFQIFMIEFTHMSIAYSHLIIALISMTKYS